MSLTDVMSSMGLHLYAEVGLVIFGAAFVWICIHALRRDNGEEFERARLLPLEEDDASPGKGTNR